MIGVSLMSEEELKTRLDELDTELISMKASRRIVLDELIKLNGRCIRCNNWHYPHCDEMTTLGGTTSNV